MCVITSEVVSQTWHNIKAFTSKLHNYFINRVNYDWEVLA